MAFVKLGQLRQILSKLIEGSFQLTSDEVQVIKDWTWHSATQRMLSPDDLMLLKNVGLKQKANGGFKLPKILYRGVRLKEPNPSNDAILRYVAGTKSWSKTVSGATYYIKTNKLSGRPDDSVLFKWVPKFDDVFVDFDALNALTGVDQGADEGEYAADATRSSIVSVDSQPVHGRNGDATRLVVTLR